MLSRVFCLMKPKSNFVNNIKYSSTIAKEKTGDHEVNYLLITVLKINICYILSINIIYLSIETLLQNLLKHFCEMSYSN